MKKILRLVLILVVAIVGYLSKSKIGGDEAPAGNPPTEVAQEEGASSSGSKGERTPPRVDPPKSTEAEKRPDLRPKDPAPESEPEPQTTPRGVDRRGESAIMNAFRAKRSDVQINFTGRIKFMLPYDDDPPRHQQWVMELSNGHTVKVAHNTDLAPKVPGIDRGDTVTVYGEYEYNEKGGVIHWTHHDPRKRHIGGYVQYKGKKYE